MTITRTFTAIILTLILAACGGTGPTPTPPTETPPATPTPTPPTTPTPTPPTEPVDPNVPYYGEWAWSWQETGDLEFYDEGRFSIVQTLEGAPADAGFGFYQTCYDGTCYDQLEGGVLFGPDEDNNLTIIMYRLNSANDPVTTYQATDEDGELEADEQGRLVFEGRGQSLDNVTSDALNGDFRAILTDLPTTFPPVEGAGSRLELSK